MRFITESTPYSDEQVHRYTVQAIRVGEISYNVVNNMETSIMSENEIPPLTANF